MNEGILMRVLFCKIHCSPFMCFYKPSNSHIYNSESDPIKLENTPQQVSSTAVSVADSESDDSSCSQVKEDDSLNVNEEEDEEKTVVVLKSCVKKTLSESDVIIVKKRVSWMDVLGKELAEVKEFESRYDYDGGNSCLCVIL